MYYIAQIVPEIEPEIIEKSSWQVGGGQVKMEDKHTEILNESGIFPNSK